MAAGTDMEGRCISCGFLAQHEEIRVSQEHQEVKPEERDRPEEAYGPSILPGGGKALGSYLVCFLSKADLFAEVNALPPPLPRAVNQVLRLDRRCPHYLRYEIGLSPKEHLMERRLGALEEDRRAFRRALDNGARRLTWAALILGSALALGQIIAALIAMTPDSYGAKLFQRVWSAPTQQIERTK